MLGGSESERLRIGGLRRFAVAITLLNILGHTLFGFEQSIAQPLVAIATAYSMEFLLEWLDAWATGRQARFGNGFRAYIDFFLSAHISGLAVAMLLYANDRLWVICFAAGAAIASKYVFRIAVAGRRRHFYNPSNFGITLTLISFPWVGIAPPYMFTENLFGAADWLLPLFIICSGTMLNWKFTRRLPLIAAWLFGFAVQASIRSQFFGTPFVAPFLPFTGVAYLLFTFYMITDPGTTPSKVGGQIVFGLSVAIAYGLLMVNHIVFDLFFALTIVCTLRGLFIFASESRLGLVPSQMMVWKMAVASRLKTAGEGVGD